MKELNKGIKCISRYKQNKQEKRKNNRILLSAFYHFILTPLASLKSAYEHKQRLFLHCVKQFPVKVSYMQFILFS